MITLAHKLKMYFDPDGLKFQGGIFSAKNKTSNNQDDMHHSI